MYSGSNGPRTRALVAGVIVLSSWARHQFYLHPGVRLNRYRRIFRATKSVACVSRRNFRLEFPRSSRKLRLLSQATKSAAGALPAMN